MKTGYDDLFSQPQQSVSEFVFDDNVAGVFADMIKRSVPGYSTLLTGIAAISNQYATPGSNCYDLGCSIGASTLSMSNAIPHPDCKIIAIDNSAAMINHCRENFQQTEVKQDIEIICDDVLSYPINNASVVVMNLTLQFIPLHKRQHCINRIYEGLLPGGVLILSEKLDFINTRENQWQQTVHHGFKQLQGYSTLEISQKRTALENVLIPETQKTHQQRLETAGFQFTTTWFQCFNFVSMIAIK